MKFIKRWLLAEDISSQMGGSMMISFFRIGFTIVFGIVILFSILLG